MADREKGVQTAPCGACGKDLPVEVTQADGSVTTAECPKCKPTKTEVASAVAAARESGTDVSGKDA